MSVPAYRVVCHRVVFTTGIDAVELKDGNFALPDRVIPLLEKFPIKSREVTLADETKIILDVELKKLPTNDTPDFRQWDIDENRIEDTLIIKK